jgi:Lon-like ATP-dependent protease
MTELSEDIDESESSRDPDDLLGGLDVNTSADISVPNKLIEQVIGQDHARDVVRKAAKQKRHVLMIGSPGTGKSMLSKAMAELMPNDNFQDVLLYPNEDDDTEPKTRVVPAGKGEQIVEAHKREAESIIR